MTSNLEAAINSLPRLLAQRVARSPDAPMFVSANAAMTFAQFDARTAALAHGLIELGVRPGDAVALAYEDPRSSWEAWWGVLRAGGVGVFSGSTLRSADAPSIIRECAASTVLCSGMTGAVLAPRRASIPQLQYLVGTGDDSDVQYETLMQRSASGPLPHCDTDDLAALIYSTDRPGEKPRGVMLSHGNYLANARAVGELMPVRRGDVVGIVGSPAEPLTQVAGLLVALLTGSSVLVGEGVRNPAELDCGTVPAGVVCEPAALAGLVRALEVDEQRSIEFVVSSTLESSLYERLERLDVRVVGGFGPVEATALVTSRRPWETSREQGAAGLPLRGQSVGVLDTLGNVCPTGGLGEVCVQGPNVMHGYYGRPRASAAAMEGTWLRTGVLGYTDPAGVLHVTKDSVGDFVEPEPNAAETLA